MNQTGNSKAKNIHEEDAGYWQAFCRGNKDSIAYFYKKYYNLLYNYGLKFVDDSLLVQDFIQDIFYKLYKNPCPRELYNVRVYLLTAMRNMAYDYYAKRKELVSIEDMDFLIPYDEHSFASFFSNDDEEKERWEAIIAAIHELPNRQKQILYLHYIKELSHKEIAEILAITPQTSMNMCSKAVNKLRHLLDKETAWVVLLFFLCQEKFLL